MRNSTPCMRTISIAVFFSVVCLPSFFIPFSTFRFWNFRLFLHFNFWMNQKLKVFFLNNTEHHLYAFAVNNKNPSWRLHNTAVPHARRCACWNTSREDIESDEAIYSWCLWLPHILGPSMRQSVFYLQFRNQLWRGEKQTKETFLALHCNSAIQIDLAAI